MDDTDHGELRAYGVLALATLGILLLGLELLAVLAFLSGERAEVACGADGTCTISRSGSFGSFHPIGTFPSGHIVDVDLNCRTTVTVNQKGRRREDTSCRPGIWVTGWEGPAQPEVLPGHRTPSVPAGAVFVPLADRSHHSWHPSPSRLAAVTSHEPPSSLRIESWLFVPFRFVPPLVGAELIGGAVLLDRVRRRRAAADESIRRRRSR